MTRTSVHTVQVLHVSILQLPPNRTLVLSHEVLRERPAESAVALSTFLGVDYDDRHLWSFVDNLPMPRCHLGPSDWRLRHALHTRSWGRLPKRCSTEEGCSVAWRQLMVRLLLNTSRSATYRSVIPLTSSCSLQ